MAPTTDDVVSCLDLGDELWDFLRKMLQVSVHRNDDVAAGRVERGLQGRRLPVVSPQFDDLEPRFSFQEILRDQQTVIAASVVDEDELELIPVPKWLRAGVNAVEQERKRLFLIVERDHNTDQGAGSCSARCTLSPILDTNAEIMT